MTVSIFRLTVCVCILVAYAQRYGMTVSHNTYYAIGMQEL